MPSMAFTLECRATWRVVRVALGLGEKARLSIPIRAVCNKSAIVERQEGFFRKVSAKYCLD